MDAAIDLYGYPLFFLTTAIFPVSSRAAIPLGFCPRTPPGTVITIDGAITERAWENALRLSLRDVVSGTAPQWTTTVRVMWDTTYLYVAFSVSDRTLSNTMVGHDEPLYQQDVVELFVDPDGDGIYYYEFEWNCLGAVFDLLMAAAPAAPLPPGETIRNQLDWTAAHSLSAVRLSGTANNNRDTDSGMTVEVALAWRDVARSRQPLPPRVGDTLRINFYRIEYLSNGTAEYTAWSPTGVTPPQFHVPSMFGQLIMSGTVDIGCRPTPYFGGARDGRQRKSAEPRRIPVLRIDGRRVKNTSQSAIVQ